MQLKNSHNNTDFQPSLRGKAQSSEGFLAGAEEDGGAKTSEFGGDEP